MIPEYSEAIVSFREFLSQQGIPDNIIWVAPKHTICYGFQRWKIFYGECIEDYDLNILYEAIKKQPFGVRFCVLCASDINTYCYLSIPADVMDAERKALLSQSIKFTVPSVIPRASIVKRGAGSILLQIIEFMKYSEWKSMAFRMD